ncbi:hypothetical protein SAY86_031650 [Trapa natans]|uniref:Trichome birefringence-like C-terminal domain-containing protein n=1 Tax=Trapa natans TaxID=22666 RepID=A0AAN7R636_TRANT|nr:hypothetical protein SAY86_031650 [Trapa natans]
MEAVDFLERLRGKRLVFVGDSLNRNMWESLVCILRDSLKNKKRVLEISERFQEERLLRLQDYNCSVDFVSSPFMVRESTFRGRSRNGSFETLRLDLMDRTTSMYRHADIIVFNIGHWWTHEKTSRGNTSIIYFLKAYSVHLSSVYVERTIIKKGTMCTKTQSFGGVQESPKYMGKMGGQ